MLNKQTWPSYWVQLEIGCYSICLFKFTQIVIATLSLKLWLRTTNYFRYIWKVNSTPDVTLCTKTIKMKNFAISFWKLGWRFPHCEVVSVNWPVFRINLNSVFISGLHDWLDRFLMFYFCLLKNVFEKSDYSMCSWSMSGGAVGVGEEHQIAGSVWRKSDQFRRWSPTEHITQTYTSSTRLEWSR